MRKKKGKKREGLINGGLNFLREKIMNLLENGMFGKLFTSNKIIEKKAESGIIIGGASVALEKGVSSFHRRMLKFTDQSLFVNWYRYIIERFCTCRLNWYGTYFISFGVYSLMTYIIKTLVVNDWQTTADLFIGEHLIWSILIIMTAVPLLAGKDSLYAAIYNSDLIRPLLQQYGGISENKFRSSSPRNKYGSYFIAVILGMITGSITFFISPVNVLLAMLFALVAAIFMAFPEIGVLVTIFVAPFLGFFEHPTLMLVVLVSTSFLSYFFKLLIGKRSFRFRLTDALMLLLLIVFVFGGIITSGGQASLNAAITYAMLMLVYVLVVNLFNTKQWLQRCVGAIALPSAITALFGIVGYAFTNMQSRWLDSSMFGEITNRTVATFENPNMLATYLVLTAPFIWSYVVKKDSSINLRILSIIGAIISGVCIVFTWSRGGWLGMIFAFVIFCMINYKHTLKLILAALLSFPLWSMLVPSSIMSRFMSIGNLSDSSTYYRLYTWKGSLKLFADHIFGGIGVGESAFLQLYPLYSFAGIEGTMHSHNLFLQIAIELGIVGLVLFLVIVFLICQKGFGCLKYSGYVIEKTFISAGLAGFAGALLHGMVDHIFYNYRVFFIFWLVAAVICSYASVFRDETGYRRINVSDRREKSASLEVFVDK